MLGLIQSNRDGLKPQLQIRAGAEKSTDTREIMSRLSCTLGATRLIIRCADAVAMLVIYGYETLTNQNIETMGRYYFMVSLWYPPTNHATGILRYLPLETVGIEPPDRKSIYGI